jgi:hypothetical protein
LLRCLSRFFLLLVDILRFFKFQPLYLASFLFPVSSFSFLNNFWFVDLYSVIISSFLLLP